MQLLLSRHGNTFNPDDKPVWVGARNDLPLVSEGLAQAARLGDAINKSMLLSAIYCGPLKRTRLYAEIVSEHLDESIAVSSDERLGEVDYGDWSGLTDAEVSTRFGDDELRGWNEKCIWPESGNWSSAPEVIQANAQAFVDEMFELYGDDANVLAVTSNGTLRYFLKLAQLSFEKRILNKTFKVGTGKLCMLKVTEDGISEIFWNENPAILLQPL